MISPPNAGLGLASLFKLRDAVIADLARCKVPKWRALASMADRAPDVGRLFFDAGDARGDEAAALAEACVALLNDEAREQLRAPARLSLPGTVVHLAVRWNERRRAPRTVDAFVTPRDHFHDIAVSGSMLADHFPWRVADALDATAAEEGAPPPPSFEPASGDMV